jgi:hypothetical protein
MPIAEPYDLFISYSHHDSEWVVGWLLPRLRAAGLRVCIDRESFDIGVPSLVNMERAVDNSRHTLLVLTPTYVASEWCEFEELLTQTQDPAGRRRRLLPLLLQTCTPPSRIAMLTYADFRDPASYDRQLARVIDALQGRLNLRDLGPELRAFVQPELAAPDDRHEQDYLARVRDECRYLDSEGVDRRRAELRGVFVMLQALKRPAKAPQADVAPTEERAIEMGLVDRAAEVLPGRDRDKKPDAPPPVPPPPPVPLAQALKEHQHLVLLGEPGAGKTTTLQYLALCFATPGLASQELGLDEPRIPIRIALRAGYGGGERLDDYLLRQLYLAYVPEHVGRAWLAEGRLIVLLDGLDEVGEQQRSGVLAAIERFAGTDAGRRSRIVLTSRIAGYASDSIRDAGHYTLQPFAGAADALPYIRGWLRALKPDLDAEPAAAETEQLLAHLQGLKQVSTNPLLLRLVIAVYVETGEPPRDRAALYERYLSDVAWKRALARESPCWDYPAIQAALEAVAWRLQIEGECSVPDLLSTVEAEMPRTAWCREPLDYLRECMGILAEYPDAQNRPCIAFRHLTFREYFVARRLRRAWQAPGGRQRAFAFLRSRLHHPAWREPLLLLAGMLDEQAAADLVLAIWKEADSPYEWELHRDLLLASEVAGSAPALSLYFAR